MKRTLLLAVTALALAAPARAQDMRQRELVVLGAGQDAGAPQIGNAGDDGPRYVARYWMRLRLNKAAS